MNNILKAKLESGNLYGSITTTEINNLKRTIDEEINEHNDEYLNLYRGKNWKEKGKLKLAMKDNCTLLVYIKDNDPLSTPIKLLEKVVIQTEWARWYEKKVQKVYDCITKIEYNKLTGKGVDNATNILH